jgi:hypothetical protein
MPTEHLSDVEAVIVWTGDSPLVRLTGLPRSEFHRGVKRAIDVACSSAAVVALWPVITLHVEARQRYADHRQDMRVVTRAG